MEASAIQPGQMSFFAFALMITVVNTVSSITTSVTKPNLASTVQHVSTRPTITLVTAKTAMRGEIVNSTLVFAHNSNHVKMGQRALMDVIATRAIAEQVLTEPIVLLTGICAQISPT